MLCGFCEGMAYCYESEEKYDILLNADFDGCTVGELDLNGAVSYKKRENGYCMEYSHSNGGNLFVGKWFNSSFSEGRYCISYDIMCTDTGAYKPFHLIGPSVGWFAMTTANYMPMKLQSGESITFHRNTSWMYDDSLTQSYTANTWYSIEIWLDMDNYEQKIYINGKPAAEMKLPDSVSSWQGFGIQASPTGADSEGATYIDNIRVIKEKSKYSEGFDPVYVDYSIAENVIGNNFFTDKKPEFELTFSNRLPEEKTYRVTYQVKTKDGESVGEGISGALTLAGNEITEKSFSPNAGKFGVMELEITFSSNEGREFKKVIPFTYSNRDTTKPLNKTIGVSTHMNRGRGTPEEIIPLAADAGIGIVRGEDFSWGGFEATAGKYELTDHMKSIVSLLKENKVQYMDIIYGTHSAYIGDDSSNPDDIMYEKLAAAITELLNQTDGTIAYLENWNEYHSPEMSGNLSENADVSAKLHRAIYQGAQKAEKKPKVLAFAEDDWGLFPGGKGNAEYGLMNKTLNILGGEKVFDAVSYHPYPDPDENYFEKDKYHTEDLPAIRSILKNNGYDENTPIIFSELGWCDYMFDYDGEEKADYIVRANAHSIANGLAEVVCIYNFTDYADCASDYGITKGYSDSAEEIPFLGKESFVAVSYYNSIAADKTAKNVDLGIENSYCYNFTAANGQQTLMLGLYEGEPVDISIKCNSKTVVIGDIYGNEKTVNTINGVLNTELMAQAQYIKGDFPEELNAEAKLSEKPYAIVKGTAAPKEELVLAVYKSGADASEIGEIPIGEAVYYYAQVKADEAGSFSFALPSDLTADTELSAVVKGKKTNKSYYIYSHGNAVVVYNTEEGSDGKINVYQTASMLSDKYTDCENAVVIGAVYNGDMLKGCTFSKDMAKNGNIIILETAVTAQNGDEVKGYFWKNYGNMEPIGKSIILHHN